METIILLFISFVIFLFSLFVLSRDDYVIIRKNVSTESIFNSAFLTSFVSLFFARLFYILIHWKLSYLSPLVFFVFPYFPGLSSLGALLGGAGFLMYYLPSKKIPFRRVLDYFAISYLYGITFGSGLYYAGLVLFKKNYITVIEEIVLIVLCFVFSLLFLPMQRKGEIKEGSVSALLLLSISTVFIIFDIVTPGKKTLGIVGTESIVYGVLFLGSILFLLQNEQILRIFNRNAK